MKKVLVLFIAVLAFFGTFMSLEAYNESNSYAGNVRFGYTELAGPITSSTTYSASALRYSVAFDRSKSGETFKVWYRLYNSRTYATSKEYLLDYDASFSRFSANMSITTLGTPVYLHAGREHIIDPSEYIYGTWGYGS